MWGNRLQTDEKGEGGQEMPHIVVGKQIADRKERRLKIQKNVDVICGNHVSAGLAPLDVLMTMRTRFRTTITVSGVGIWSRVWLIRSNKILKKL